MGETLAGRQSLALAIHDNLCRGLCVSKALEAGMIGLNRGLVSDPAAPSGGVNRSYGRGLVRDSTPQARQRTSEYTQ
jgi:acyl-CoA reductase-like NAD-dependent aldehyde dehydrogenase